MPNLHTSTARALSHGLRGPRLVSPVHGVPKQKSGRDDTSLQQPDRLPAALREEADRALAEQVERGELLPSGEFALRLGISPQALSKAQRNGRMFFVQLGTTRLYPSFFFDPAQERRQLEQVCKVLGDLPGGSKLGFFTTPKVSLGRQTPLRALQQGRLADVLAAAQSFVDN